MEKKYKLNGLDCPACFKRIELKLKQYPEIKEFKIDLLGDFLYITSDTITSEKLQEILFELDSKFIIERVD